MERLPRGLAWLAVSGLLITGCEPELPPDGSYFDDQIAPVIEGSCLHNAGGCHVGDDGGQAPGNLDLTSYDALMRRQDLLATYGPYPVPTLLLKTGPAPQVYVETLDAPDPLRPDERSVRVTVDIRHAGGRIIDQGSTTDRLLRQWLAAGYTRTGVPRARATTGDGSCVAGAGTAAGFDPGTAPSDAASFDRFQSEVAPILRARCSSAACHGAALADFHLACGDDTTEQRWNWFIATQFLGDPVERSELLRRPLPADRGGTFHGGGAIFEGTSDSAWMHIRDWAASTVASDPAHYREADASPGYRFFANRVIPVFVREGCMVLGCHSPIGLRFQLRGGSGGAFSTFARRRNYALARAFLSLESDDPRHSRLVEKNLFPPGAGGAGEGITHRGGALFEDEGRDRCADFDVEHGDLDVVPSYCVIARWHALERAEAIARGEVQASPAPHGVLYVERPSGVGRPTEVDVYRPGADLRLADASLDATGALSLGPSTSLLAGCGLDVASADVRGPATSWDGSRIAFSVRTSEGAPARLYWADATGGGCEPIPGVAAAVDRANGILTHDLDPAFAPDGTIVFVSTRGDLDRADLVSPGPTRTPARLEPNANLFVFDPASGSVRQLTFLLDQELAPSFMGDGHVIYTTEKRADDFHVLALRRQLLDGGDYHPLYASRDSLGFDSATEVVELIDGRFAFVAAELDTADGAGAIAVFDRSIGPDQADRDPADRAYVHSLRMMPAGVFRSPSPLPNRRILVSCAGAAAPSDFDLCELDPQTGDVRTLAAVPGRAEIEAVALFARSHRSIARSDGREIDHPIMEPGATDAVVRFTDFPMIESLMFTNTRTFRPIDDRIGGIEILTPQPPPAGITRFEDLPPDRVVTDTRGRFWRDRRSLGVVMLLEDGSARIRLPGGTPLMFAPTDAAGHPLDFDVNMPFTGRLVQREAEQYYPGERITRSVPRQFFNGLCGGCHGSISGRELDVAVSLDVISGASTDRARLTDPVDLR